jgi:hypothetical protein
MPLQWRPSCQAPVRWMHCMYVNVYVCVCVCVCSFCLCSGGRLVKLEAKELCIVCHVCVYISLFACMHA